MSNRDTSQNVHRNKKANLQCNRLIENNYVSIPISGIRTRNNCKTFVVQDDMNITASKGKELISNRTRNKIKD